MSSMTDCHTPECGKEPTDVLVGFRHTGLVDEQGRPTEAMFDLLEGLALTIQTATAKIANLARVTYDALVGLTLELPDCED